ncbi:polysaccharide deacetylase [Alkalihalobacillus alcalophilus ATCC 27647 = CGMCC 1.3604]|uniref:Polysaccharide deacetylase n=1 Tax=Alkalihalobacillus alcalophilus ATCC 27647 = CGMCC 1.3604 TaxID=1218173 RepID=A0A094WKL7_ALKAL|nr:polysaccharide deacetylase family sporulation protein PdaB [Alkalihalobacillus alcalophilus]KGA98269.1 polysaccharide deacetylase [Alkalihalobacillus alcalophilus ATCC 27647 = CGMCC 1.3604]MED1561585.1 polysaccharide deacetylase family sporulation protein PdaB [Alkalihalobacillus alcalophilus]THG89868.1 polysaccharide deacetylase [Alkalihalobacillus alcalophilus ATCC 27647 = CGMCC 1.3604]
MNLFWVFHAKRLKSLSIIVLTAFMAAVFLYVERTQLPVFSTPEGPQAFYRAEIEQKEVALTFNISWGEQRVSPILEILEEEGVKEATFFVSASWAERYPDLVKQIIEKGHMLGSHGYQYKNYTSWEDEKVTKDIQTSQRVLTDLAGKSPHLLRPPNGDFDKRILNIADEQGLSIIHWSIDSKDYTNPGVETIVSNVLDETTAGDILLFHASDSVKQTHEALPIVIKELKDKGFQFISVDQMMENAKTSSEEIK